MENGTRRAVLYARVSTEEQVKGYSLPQQLQALRSYAASEGYEVIEECEDPGYSGLFMDRPGLDRARDLIEGGEVAVVLAQDADRITRKAAHRLTLDEEAERHGARWLALDDWGDESHEGKLLRFMKGWAAEGESLKTRERSRRGQRRKVSEGKLIGVSPRPRYDFSYVRDGNGKPVGYKPDPNTMPIVVKILSMLADGYAIHAAARALEDDGVPAPRGGISWSRRTVREMVLEDTYRPHTVEELVGKVPADVLASLDPEGLYGIAYSGRVVVRKVSNSRRVRETPGRESWIGVPVSLAGSGLDAATVDQARAAIRDNRVPRKVGDRFYELGNGPLYCAHCGWRMLGHARRHKGRPPNAYYRCNSPSRKGSTCPNRRSHRAGQMEYEAARLFEQTATRAAMRDLYERAVEQKGLCLDVRGSAERQAALAEQLAVLDEERLGYLRQNARGVLADGDLDDMLAEVDEKRKAISSQVRQAEDATETARRLKAARDSLAGASSYDPVHAEWYEDPDAIQPHEFLTVGASPEQIRAAYMRHGARFEADENGVLTLRLEIDLGGGEIVANRWHTHGNELWEFDEHGLMRRRDASINDYKIEESERKFRWSR